MADKKQSSCPKRIFVSDVDRYSSKHIAKVKNDTSVFNVICKSAYQTLFCSKSSNLPEQFLSTCEAGETSEDGEAEETLNSPRGEPAFHVVGSVSSSSKDEKSAFLLEQYTVSQAFKKQVLHAVHLICPKTSGQY